ncbi:major facilitator superfamily transporter [Ligilactobacillus salitolerans]|uniref:Major facilitator superfamily transporter n=1 Tax=Ligilactobacillus salitolerans TaxID=1808352 RepID=A0A401IQP4_9LACO|nr:MFS transporter [Ligilactobacillus salitolerans]GBG93851.1 major facilitator superfamily transporter [Ligilactobacillus salitolerans]
MNEQKVSRQTIGSIAAAAILSFIGILVETSLNVTFPELTREFSVSLGTMQWVTSGYLLMVTIVMSTTGFLNQKFNSRTLFMTAIIFNMIGTLLCATAQSFPILLGGRLLQAISTGVSTPLMYHIVLSLVPQSKRGVYLGIAAMIISLAPALGPTYGGTLSAFWSWRAIFIVALVFLLVAALIGGKYIRLEARGTTTKFDWLGVILLTVTFGSLSLAFANAGNYGFSDQRFGWLFVVFGAAAVLLGLHLHFSQRKILNFGLLHNPVVGLRWLNFFILQFINIGISFVIPIFIEDNLHASAFIAGLVLLPGSLIGAAISPLAGRIFDQHGAFVPLLCSSIFILIGTTLFYLSTFTATLLMIMLIYVFLRSGFNLGFSNSMTDASLQVSADKNADLNSLFNTFQQFAGSFGTSVLSAVISAKRLQPGKVESLTASGSRVDYGLLVVLALISLSTVVISRQLKSKKLNNL